MPSQAPITPLLSLKVPSLHDSKLLQARIYLPNELYEKGGNIHTKTIAAIRRVWCKNKRVAVVAHPYATLGGNYNDHVVLHTVEALVKSGWAVGTFNFRGAGVSQGSTSWTGKPEIGDYEGILGGLVAFADSLHAIEGGEKEGDGESGNVDGNTREKLSGEFNRRRIKVLMAGYSYGSLITSHLPPMEEMVRKIDSMIESSSAYKTCIAGLRGSGRFWGGNPHQYDKIIFGQVLEIREIEIQPSYLLISPLLPPLSSFLTLSFLNFASTRSLTSEEFGERERGNILVVYGDGDIFTSAAKYRKWREKWAPMGEGGVQARNIVEITGAGHFWIEEGAVSHLVTTIEKWADGLSVQE